MLTQRGKDVQAADQGERDLCARLWQPASFTNVPQCLEKSVYDKIESHILHTSAVVAAM